MSADGRLLTIEQAAEYLGLPSKRALYRLVEAGDITHVRVGRSRVLVRQTSRGLQRVRKSGRIYFYERDLDTWKATHRVEATTRERAIPSSTPSASVIPLPPRHERRFS